MVTLDRVENTQTFLDQLEELRIENKELRNKLKIATNEVVGIFESCQFHAGIIELAPDGLRQVHQTSVAAASYGDALQIKSGKLYSELGNTAEDCAMWLERSLVCKETESVLKYEDYNSIAQTYAATTLKYIGIGENGNPKFFYLAHDITDLKKAEKIRDEHRCQIAHLSKMSALGEMASGIAHEILNPVAIIKGSADLLNARLKKKGHLEDLSLTSVISENCTRIADIIDGLRDFSRSGNLDKCEQVNLKDLIGGIFPLCQNRFKAAGIAFDWSTISEELTLFCRPVQISQVFINLLNNAHDAVKDQRVKRVEISAHPVGNYLRVEIKDSGPGILLPLQLKIFEPFFTTKAAGEGTGLGLSICREIMESHGGTIEMTSSDLGTEFQLNFVQRSVAK